MDLTDTPHSTYVNAGRMPDYNLCRAERFNHRPSQKFTRFHTRTTRNTFAICMPVSRQDKGIKYYGFAQICFPLFLLESLSGLIYRTFPKTATMSHLETCSFLYLYIRKRLAKSATMFHLGMRPALYLYTRKRNVRWQCSDSNTTQRCAPNTRASLGGVTSPSGAIPGHRKR